MIDRKCACGRRIRKERLEKDLWTCWECAGRYDDCPFCGKPKKKENKRCQSCRTQQQRAATKHCRGCDIKLSNANWSEASQRKFSYQCDKCRNAEALRDLARKLERNPDFYKDAYRKDPKGRVEKNRNYNRQLKQQIMAHYGDVCACCGESELIMLSLDHINGDGAKHRKEIGRVNFYSWVRANGYPDFLRILCFNCNIGRYRNGGACPHEDTRLKLVA